MSFSFTDLLSTNNNNSLNMDDDPFGLEFANNFKSASLPLSPSSIYPSSYAEFPPGFVPTSQSLNSHHFFSSQNVSYKQINYYHHYCYNYYTQMKEFYHV